MLFIYWIDTQIGIQMLEFYILLLSTLITRYCYEMVICIDQQGSTYTDTHF